MADYIKREDVLALSHYDDHDCEIVDVEDVEKLPSADVVERKKGKWIDSRCSECGGLMPITKVMLRGKVMWETDYPMSRFCPNCGADMRGKDNG